MNHAPTIDTPLIPGIRREFDNIETVAGAATVRSATERFPARAILRRYLLMVNTNMEDAANVRIRLAFGDTATPVAADFIGSGLIVPEMGEAGTTATYTPDGELSSHWREVNYQLPPRPGRILYSVLNGNVVGIIFKFRMILDGLATLGLDNGRR